MAECRDFFDEPTSAVHRSSSLGDIPSIPTPPAGLEEVGEHGLELTLGLGPSCVGGIHASCPPQVRPASVYTCLPKQPSGNFASSAPFVHTSDVSHTSFSQVDASKGLQNCSGEAEVAGLAKQRSGNFDFTGTHTHPSFAGQSDKGLAVKALFPSGDTEFPSRDQIWLTLQKNGAVSVQDARHPNEASSMWGRRSASMHVTIPRCKDVGGAENDQIRRSCSSGVFPLMISRQMSSVESSLEKSPQQNMVGSPGRDHEQEALEDLRKRKELQAQRRQVARKRRKILVEEKQQHKKSKHSSSSLQRLGSRQNSSANDKLSLGGTHTSEDGVTQEPHCASPDALKHEGQEKVMKAMQTIQNSHREETRQGNRPQCANQDKKVDMLVGAVDEDEGSYLMHSKGGMSSHRYNTKCMPIKDGALNRPPHEHNSGSLSSMMSTEFEQPTSIGKNKFVTTGNEHNHGGLHNSHAVMVMSVRAGPCMNQGEGGKSSETECVESSSIHNDSKPLQCTSEKGGVGEIVSSASSTAPLARNSMSYPPFPLLAVPYTYSVGAATPTAIPIQPGLPFPFLVQYPSHGDKTTSPLNATCHLASVMNPAVSLPGTLSSKASSANKDCIGESFEGKGDCGEKPAFPPASRTVSNPKHVNEETQCLGGLLESQVTFPASQLSSISSVVSDTCNTKNFSPERQQSVAFGGRLLSQNSSVQDHFTLSSKQERPTLTQRGIDVQHELSDFRVGGSTAEVKQAEMVKLEERNVESQLGSELSGVDGSFVQSGSVERRQKSGSFAELPWVTTTGKGPNGKTINGVLYIANGQHVRLVCSCHGLHLSPMEFVEHSGSTDLSNPERSIVVCPFPSLNHQLASAPV